MCKVPRHLSTAFRAPLAERSAVNRQVLGSIPSGGVHFLFSYLLSLSGSVRGLRTELDAMAQWQRVGFQIRRLGVRIPLASAPHVFLVLLLPFTRGRHAAPPCSQSSTPWRNGSASDSKSEGWGFESLWRQDRPRNLFCVPVAQLDKASDYESEDWGFESLQG